MAHRWVIVTASIVALVSIVPLFMAVGKDFLPKNDESQFEVSVRTPEGTTLEQTELIATRIGREVKQLSGRRLHRGPGRERRSAHGQSRHCLREARRRAEAGPVPVRDHGPGAQDGPPEVRRRESCAPASPRWPPFPVAAWPTRRSRSTSAGRISPKLAEYSRRLTDALGKVPGVVDIDTSLILGKPETGGEPGPEEGRGAGGAGGGRRRHAPRHGRRAQDLDLQREWRAVRGPRPRRAAVAHDRRWRESDGRSLDQARCRQHGQRGPLPGNATARPRWTGSGGAAR